MKIKVALCNLYISQAIILVFFTFAYFLWFPHSFIQLSDFYKTAGIVISVNLVLGPLLIFIIYKENKKNLKLDLNILLSIQLIAFIFGAYSLFLKHPAYAVFSIDRFVLTNVGNIYPQPSRFEQTKNHFFSSPELVVAQIPKNTDERNALMLDVATGGQPDIESRPKYFSPLAQHIQTILKKGIQLEQLDLNPQSEHKLALFTKKHGGNYTNLIFFPLRASGKREVIWAFDKNTAKPVDILHINPWKVKLAKN